MNLLVLGGTVFVGRAIVEEARSRGHQVTAFHRGQRGGDILPDVPRIIGNRDGDLAELANGTWDAVIDTCGYHPRVVGKSVDALKSRTGLYLFISTVSVYAEDDPAPLTESSPLARFESEPTSEEITGESYGPFKVLCEEVIRRGFGSKAQIVRPGLVIGPNDPSDRFTYWPVRMKSQSEVLVPDYLSQPSQWIDTRDLASLTMDVLESGKEAVVHATGPERPITLGETLERVRAVVNPECRFVPASKEFLAEQEVRPWQDLPLSLPQGEPDAIARADIRHALELGLRLRPVESTVRDLMEWWSSLEPRPLKTGLSPEREAELIRALA